jgi:hypothetical protein
VLGRADDNTGKYLVREQLVDTNGVCKLGPPMDPPKFTCRGRGSWKQQILVADSMVQVGAVLTFFDDHIDHPTTDGRPPIPPRNMQRTLGFQPLAPALEHATQLPAPAAAEPTDDQAAPSGWGGHSKRAMRGAAAGSTGLGGGPDSPGGGDEDDTPRWRRPSGAWVAGV